MREASLLGIVAVLAPLSMVSIGGASSVYAPLQHQTVDVLGWLTPQEFTELFAIARVTPGPGTMLATLIGFKVAGLPGAAVATLALFVPSSILCFLVARVWSRYRGRPWHQAFENGLAPLRRSTRGTRACIPSRCWSAERRCSSPSRRWPASVGRHMIGTGLERGS
jgi:chromate transporter